MFCLMIHDRFCEEDGTPIFVVSVLQVRNIANCTLSRTSLAQLVKKLELINLF